jgi:nucleotide-binding universal stress UspA family protein
MKAIVAAIDFSNATPAVMDNAISLAKSSGARLDLLHVIAPEPGLITYGFTPTEFPAMNAFREETKRRATIKMEELLTEARKSIPTASSHIADGSPLLELLNYVKQHNADFVVVGSHGHGIIGSLLLGSIAEGMVRKASAPTLIVPVASE